ncbi:hypothetical protein [Shewanella livingstonensis]|uniref:DUF2384 domain-containing protein n=1 Tax=Shewanella livingstonensis TaxID=150120 RepID=A0A3G8M059_9GAMM|nr:hypothetical protein [Shewanella livingstonensis]AZG74502.1 hypothetical protein EGC82_18135 [Shewanella livingstonensis]
MTTSHNKRNQLDIAIDPFLSQNEKDYLVPLLLAWSGGAEAALSWFKSEPLPAYGNLTPQQLCESGKAESFVEYVKGLELGGFA